MRPIELYVFIWETIPKLIRIIDSITIYGQIDMQNTQNKPISIGKDPPNIGMTFEWTHLGSLNTFIYLVF
jgi:hypothetical protein